MDKLDTEFRRIEQQRQQLISEKADAERQIAELRQAMVDEEGVRHFCELAARNLDSFDDRQWRVLLESMRLRVLVDGSNIRVKVAVPTVKDDKGVIVFGTSQSSGR